MKSKLKFLLVRLIRKLASIAGYKVDFAPSGMRDSRDGKVQYLRTLSAKTQHLNGAIVECGLGNGFSFAYLAEEGQKSGKKVFGFDSFEGFPEPSKEDTSSYAVKQGDWGNVDLTMVEEKVLARVPLQYYKEQVSIIPGFFSDTLKDAPIEQISLLHLDGDLYQSYMDCLNVLYDKVIPGGIIAFDECLNGIEYAKYPGGFTALMNFFGDTDIDLSRDRNTGKYYIVKP